MKNKLIIAILFCIANYATLSVQAGTFCNANSNPAYNVNHCRSVGDGSGSVCLPDGTGPACEETWGFPI